eukprot:COSAG06_NODE_25252_length_641_cov_1.108856_1_plen_49_part_01
MPDAVRSLTQPPLKWMRRMPLSLGLASITYCETRIISFLSAFPMSVPSL